MNMTQEKFYVILFVVTIIVFGIGLTQTEPKGGRAFGIKEHIAHGVVTLTGMILFLYFAFCLLRGFETAAAWVNSLPTEREVGQ